MFNKMESISYNGTTITELGGGVEEIEKKISEALLQKKAFRRKKKLERLSRGKNKFIFKFSHGLPPQIINGRPLKLTVVIIGY